MTKTEYQSPSLKSALAVFTNLYSGLKKREEGEVDGSYDGDDDVEEPADAEVIGLHLQLLEAAACDLLAQGGSPLGVYSVMS